MAVILELLIWNQFYQKQPPSVLTLPLIIVAVDKLDVNNL
jgi:hypothetical protein